MNQRVTPLLLVCIALGLLNAGCGDSGSNGPLVIDGGIARSTMSLSCPTPGTLPFTTESTELQNPSNASALELEFDISKDLDVITNPTNDTIVINGRLEFGTTALDHPINNQRVTDEYVSLWAANGDEWVQLGRTLTDEDGNYSFDVVGSNFNPGVTRIYSVFEAAQRCYDHIVSVLEPGTQLIVSDIDGTLTINDGENTQQLIDVDYDQKRKVAAVEMINAWWSKGYYTVLLTARPDSERVITRVWLANHGFPIDYLQTAGLSIVNGESARRYKGDFLKRLKNELQLNIVAVYGNAETDIQAYEDAEIPKAVTFIIGPEAGTYETMAIADDDYTSHIADYIEAQPTATPPEGMPAAND
ncbi:MAG: hypothetical protein R3A47_05910 [Polyangiales bacterium]